MSDEEKKKRSKSENDMIFPAMFVGVVLLHIRWADNKREEMDFDIWIEVDGSIFLQCPLCGQGLFQLECANIHRAYTIIDDEMEDKINKVVRRELMKIIIEYEMQKEEGKK